MQLLLDLSKEIGMTEEEMKADFAANGDNPNDVDFIEFGMGYSLDGNVTYEWTTYTEEDWENYDGSDMDPSWNTDEWNDGTVLA